MELGRKRLHKPSLHTRHYFGGSDPSQRAVFITAFVFFVLYVIFVLFFFVFAFLIALRKNQLAFIDDQIAKRLFSWPKEPSFDALITSFTELGKIDSHSTFLSITWNSIWRTVLSSLLSIGSSMMVCYILVFYKNKLTRFIYNLGIFVSILPLYGSAAASYRLFENLSLLNNPMILITSISLFGGYFFYMYSFYKSLSWEYAEAAFVDGAGHFRVFFQVMLPMALPSASALYVMHFISGWNDYESTLLYMNEYPNLAYAVYAYGEVTKYNANVPAYFAGILVSLLPILVLFLCFQNTIMEKVYLGGLKG